MKKANKETKLWSFANKRRNFNHKECSSKLILIRRMNKDADAEEHNEEYK